LNKNQTASQRELIAAFRRDVARIDPSMRRAYSRSWGWLQSQMTEATMLARLQSGVPLTDLIPKSILDRAFAPVATELRTGAERGFATGVKHLTRTNPGDMTLGISFNTLSPSVLQGIATLDANILKNAKAETRESVRQFVEAGLKDGLNPRDIARGMREVVGLAPNHEEHIRNFRRKLGGIGNGRKTLPSNTLRDKRFDATLSKAIRDKVPLTVKQIDAMVAAYTRKYTAWHAEVVARTATLNAFRAGHAASVEASIDLGLVSRGDMVKVWTTVGDDRVREEHAEMEGEEVPLDQPFSNGLMVPSEWNCRCIVTYDFRPPGSRSRAEAIEIMRQRGTLAGQGGAPGPRNPTRPTPTPTPTPVRTPTPTPSPRAPATSSLPVSAPAPAPAPAPVPAVPSRSVRERLAGPVTTEETTWLNSLTADKVSTFDDVLATLKAERTITPLKYNAPIEPSTTLTPKLKERVTKMAEAADALFGDVQRIHPVTVGYDNDATAFFRPDTKSIKLGPGEFSTRATTLHEIMHVYEDAHSSIVDWEIRTMRKYANHNGIKTIPGFSHSGQNVVGFEGSFIRKYQGRVYPKFLSTNSFEAAEFLSVAVESLLENPLVFKLKHPDMFNDIMLFFRRLNRP